MHSTQIKVTNDAGAGERLDRFLASVFKGISRSELVRLIKEKKIVVNGNPTKPSTILKTNDLVTVEIAERNLPIPHEEEIPLNIIYEDDQVIVLNKPAGIVVHPAHGNQSGTLVNALIQYFPGIKEAIYDINNPISLQRPGLVHRLDKDTSGVMIIAKTKRALHSLAKQIMNRDIKKIYWGIVYGWPKAKEGILVNYLGRHPKNRKKIADIGLNKGKEAISHYKVLKSLIDKTGEKFSLVEFDIKTGRTHQIRVQAAITGFPIMGDLSYGTRESVLSSEKKSVKRQLLHAKELCVTLPGENKQRKFGADLPNDFLDFLKDFGIDLI